MALSARSPRILRKVAKFFLAYLNFGANTRGYAFSSRRPLFSLIVLSFYFFHLFVAYPRSFDLFTFETAQKCANTVEFERCCNMSV